MILLLYIYRPKRFTLKSFKAACFVLHDLTMTAYKSAAAAPKQGGPGNPTVKGYSFNLT